MEFGLEKGKPPEKVEHKATGPKGRLSYRKTDEKRDCFYIGGAGSNFAGDWSCMGSHWKGSSQNP
ncbi:unnamed protein product [marine sediment metagenome]|uniref:Uncharacterized protein n=1 Tax=marine sediment metagenome TaxID=412755 RepID=X1PXV0_9ZZZZ